jgi:hypothetical protein
VSEGRHHASKAGHVRHIRLARRTLVRHEGAKLGDGIEQRPQLLGLDAGTQLRGRAVEQLILAPTRGYGRHGTINECLALRIQRDAF